MVVAKLLEQAPSPLTIVYGGWCRANAGKKISKKNPLIILAKMTSPSAITADAFSARRKAAGPGAVPGGEPGGPGLPGAQAEGARQGRRHERLQVSIIQGVSVELGTGLLGHSSCGYILPRPAESLLPR